MDSILTGKMTFSIFGYKMYEKIINNLKDSIDFIGINHYYCSWASLNPFDWDSKSFLNPPFSQNLKNNSSSDFGWSLCPESLSVSLRWVNKFWNPRNLPIMVSEHGISDSKDSKRGWFIESSLSFLFETINKYKIPVIGYTYWSLLDNYEWAAGYSQRFGLVEVNFDNQERKVRKSAEIFKKFILNSK